MKPLRKIGILFVLLGICLPTATMPFITEFHPQPDICLTSNFFGNLGNMIFVLGGSHSAAGFSAADDFISIPYRYLFSAGVVLACLGLAMIVWSFETKPAHQ